jgi:hypothetical protein
VTAETVQFDTDPNETDRLAMCDWFRRHGIDSKWIPLHSAITRWLLPDNPGIEYDQFVLDDKGNLLPDYEGGIPLDVRRETLWVPMEANPLPFPDLNMAKTLRDQNKSLDV